MNKNIRNKVIHLFVIVGLLVSSLFFLFNKPAEAYTELGPRYDQMQSSLPSATTTHLIAFTYETTSSPVGSVSIQFCSNSPLPTQPCDAPVGLDLSSAILANQTGETGFTANLISSDEILLVRNPTDPGNDQGTYEFTGIVNPSSIGEYYLKIGTYSDQTGSESSFSATAAADAVSDDSPLLIDFGGIAIDINPGLNVQTVVPPYLTFCAGVTIANLNCGSANGALVDFGNFSTGSATASTAQFIVATNCQNGFSVTLYGPSLTSGNNVIPDLSSANRSRPGTSQFGLNVVANSDPSIGSNVAGPGTGVPFTGFGTQNTFEYSTDSVIAGSSVASDFSKFTISFLVNVSKSQPAGVYSTTLSYIAVANF